ncbi:MAG: hypothetical protein WC823_06220 [Parcubacteria group bacterium]|jgi:hypothetical protein
MSRFEQFEQVEKDLEKNNNLELRRAGKVPDSDFSHLKRMPIPDKYRTLSEKEKIEKALLDRFGDSGK